MNFKTCIILLIVLLAYSCNSNDIPNEDSSVPDSTTTGPPKAIAPPEAIDACQYIQDLKIDFYKDGPTEPLLTRISVMANKSNTTPRFSGGTTGIYYPRDSFELDMRTYEQYFKCK